MKTLEDLKKVREKALEQMKIREGKFSAQVVVAMGTCGIAAGAREVMTAILDELDKRGITDVSRHADRLQGPVRAGADRRRRSRTTRPSPTAMSTRRKPARSSPSIWSTATSSASGS